MRDYKQHILETLLTLGAALKGYKKYAWKVLPVLAALLIVGVQETKAFWPLLIMGGSALLGIFGWGRNLLGDVAEGIIKGICWLVDLIVNLIGHILFWIANTTIDWAMKFNALISESPIVKEGFGVSLSVANLGLLVGFIVMAIAVMIRADWLVEARKAIPKFITAALLINFGFFILTVLIIAPVNGIFQNIYQAAKININTFSGAFMPDLDFKSLSAAQINLANIPKENSEFAEKYLAYTKIKEERLVPAIMALLKNYETGGQVDAPAHAYVPPPYQLRGQGHFPNLPVLGQETYVVSGPAGERLPLVNGKPVISSTPVFVTSQQRRAVAQAIMDAFETFLGNMNDGSRDNGSEEFWNTYDPSPTDVFSNPSVFATSGAVYKDCVLAGTAGCVSDFEILKTHMLSVIQEELAEDYDRALALEDPDNGEWGFGCRFWDASGAAIYGSDPDCVVDGEEETLSVAEIEDTFMWDELDQDQKEAIISVQYSVFSLANIVDHVKKGPSDLESIVIVVVDTLFNAIFIFLGAFTLLGVALMLFYRYIALSLLIILFPFVWLGWVFPKLTSAGGGKNIWTAWWGQFLRWLLFGPFAMFFIYLSAHAAVNIEALSQNPEAGYIGAGSMAAIAASVGNMVVIIGLLIGGTHVANKMGIMGSGMLMGTIKSSGKWLGKTAMKYANKGITNTGKAALRSEKAQNALGKLQGLASNRGRFLRTVAAPLTGSAAKLREAGQKGGREQIDEHMARFKDMRSEDIVKAYSSLRTETERMAAYKTVMQRGDYSKGMIGTAMQRDFDRWSDPYERFKNGNPKMKKVLDKDGNEVLDEDGDVVLEHVMRPRNDFDKYNQEEVLKKAKKQFLERDALQYLEDLDGAIAAREAATTPDNIAKAQAQVDRIAARFRGAVEKQLEGLSGQEVQIFIKNTGGLLGEYKTDSAKHTAGVGNLGKEKAHTAAGDALSDAIVNSRPETIRGAQGYMSAQMRAKLISKVEQAIGTTLDEAWEAMTEAGVPIPEALEKAHDKSGEAGTGMPVDQRRRADLTASVGAAISSISADPSAHKPSGMSEVRWKGLVKRLETTSVRFQGLVHSGIGQSMYAFASSSASPTASA